MLIVGYLPILPHLCRPDFDVGVETDDHDLIVNTSIVTQVEGDDDAPLLVGNLCAGGGEHLAPKFARLLLSERQFTDALSQLLELGRGEQEQTAVYTFGHNCARGKIVSKLGRDGQATLGVYGVLVLS